MLNTNLPTQFLNVGVDALLYVLLLIFLLFSLSIAYHWLSYSTNRAYSMLLLSVYAGVGALLLLTMFIASRIL